MLLQNIFMNNNTAVVKSYMNLYMKFVFASMSTSASKFKIVLIGILSEHNMREFLWGEM